MSLTDAEKNRLKKVGLTGRCQGWREDEDHTLW